MIHNILLSKIEAELDDRKLTFFESELDSAFESLVQLYQMVLIKETFSVESFSNVMMKNGIILDMDLTFEMEGFVEGVSNLISKIADGIKAVFSKITGIFSKSSESTDYVSSSSSEKVDKAVTDNSKKYNLPSKETHEKMLHGFDELLKCFISGVKSIEAPDKNSDAKTLATTAHQLFSFGEVEVAKSEDATEQEIKESVDKHKQEENQKMGVSYIELEWSSKAKSLFEEIRIEVGDEASFYKTKKKIMFGLKTKEEEQFDFKIEPLDFEKFESKTLSDAGYSSKESILSLTAKFEKVRKAYTDANTTGLFTKKVKDIEHAYVVAAKKSVTAKDYDSYAKAMAPYCVMATNFAKVYSKTFLMVLGHMNRYYLMTHKCLQDALKETEKNEKKEN